MSTLSARARSRLNSMSICGESCDDELLTLTVPGVSVKACRTSGAYASGSPRVVVTVTSIGWALPPRVPVAGIATTRALGTTL